MLVLLALCRNDVPELLRSANLDRDVSIWFYIKWFSVVDGSDHQGRKDDELTLWQCEQFARHDARELKRMLDGLTVDSNELGAFG